MPRPVWSLYAYQLIEPDEQLDLFASRQQHLHLVARQFVLGGAVDRTLCGGLLPAQPRWHSVHSTHLQDGRFCSLCRAIMDAQRRGMQPIWPELCAQS